MSLFIKVKKLSENAQVPRHAHFSDTGADIYSTEDVTLDPGEFKTIGTGIAIQANMICDIQIRPRSGLAAKHGITVLNSPATIDPTYRGEIKVILINHGKEAFHIERGDRIAQMVAYVAEMNDTHGVCDLVTAEFNEVDELGKTERGSSGFGSTGIK